MSVMAYVMSGGGKIRPYLRINREIYEKFLEKLRQEGWHSKSVSEVVELLLKWYVNGEIDDVRMNENVPPCITGDQIKSVINILEGRAADGTHSFHEKEIKMMMVEAGVLSHRDMSKILKTLITQGLLKPKSMIGNRRVYTYIRTPTETAVADAKTINNIISPKLHMGVRNEPDNPGRL